MKTTTRAIQMPRHAVPTFAVLFLVLLFAASAQLFGAERVEEIVLEENGESQQLEIHNLAGQMEVRGWDGNIRVEVTLHAEDSGGFSAEEILRMVEARTELTGNRLVVTTSLPLEKHSRYHYPDPAGRETPFLGDDLSSPVAGGPSRLPFDGKQVMLYDYPSDGALSVWADYRIWVPEGTKVSLKNRAGSLTTENLAGEILLEAANGNVTVDNVVVRLASAETRAKGDL